MASPARRCERNKCYTATNECDMAYGGCWDDCATQIPTFTQPICGPAPTLLMAGNYTAPASITMAPSSISSDIPTLASMNSTCSPLWICVDYVAKCGNSSIMYGNCYDTCNPITVTPPPCTKPPVTVTSWPDAASTTTSKIKKQRKPCKAAKAWMCAPADW
ncbi:hypothetical protein BS50DRAFT_589938 [Corynespora cassiicola Philippines]|uniref:Uncharacterized protein n=1 Tax=Corynespora cassiicola Philippines TaxID=1448308 RepID=A0A2T2NJC9_CORCC|nr:hypothetical protein BS50DRAFT_589938 [Corynespora cassiicola Philippines]